ncbi:MAG: UDP-glucose/GDP-mannose dehydrogenase family protein [Pseudomonadota bacterium]
MKILVVGAGYVGLVSGTCFAEFGFDITCVDKDQTKITQLQKGRVPIYEPGLDSLLQKQIDAGRISFTTDLKNNIADADVILIAVGTPTDISNRQADMTYVYAVAQEIAPYLTDYKVVVTKSTVPVGTAEKVRQIILKENPNANFDMVSNPEFLREGAAIEDFMKPNRVIVGTDSESAKKIMGEIYRPLFLNKTPVVYVSIPTAELAKYASNAFLATKISFINEIADLSEKVGANVQDIAHCMGLDKRIGSKFLHAGPGYGGSCFPKDTMALAEIGKEHHARQMIVEQVIETNHKRPFAMVKKILHAMSGDIQDKKIAILGIAFKPNTDDIREAPALKIIPELQKNGAKIHAHDPVAQDNATEILKDITWHSNPYDAIDGAHAVVIITEWNEYRALDTRKIYQLLKEKNIIDLRNIYNAETLSGQGFHYVCVGV